MADLFISYSRKDSEFVRTLYEHLLSRGLTVWVDWQDIPPTVDWWETISGGIEAANAVVFVISPNSLESPICHLEINHALAHNKRLIPIVRISAEPTQAFARLIALNLDHNTQEVLGERDLMSVARQNWQEIARHNWLFFLDDDALTERLEVLVETLNTDYSYVVQHTQLLVRARNWEKRGRKNGYLLRATELKEARSWLIRAQKAALEPPPTALHIDYIQRSRLHTTRQGRVRTVVMGILLVFGVALGAAIIWRFVRPQEEQSRMTGKFNMAVAPVYEINNGKPAINDDTDVLTGKIYAEIERGSSTVEGFQDGDIQVMRIRSEPIESAQDAEAIIEGYNAHIVIYGVLDSLNQTFTPQFYLDSDLIGVSEITGESAFGSPISNFPLNINNNLSAEAQLSINGFDNRVEILAQFLFGVAAFQSRIYQVTIEYFNIVLGNNQWTDAQGKKILYLWIGTLFERSTLERIPEENLRCPFPIPDGSAVPQLECARIAYEKAIDAALAENKEMPFARAHLGLGNVYHSWATALPLPICDYYPAAIDEFEEALSIEEQAGSTTTLTSFKAHFDIGASYFAYNTCLGSSDPDVLSQALDAFSAAVEVAGDLPPTNEVKALAADTYSRLGVLYASLNDLEAALLAYDRAIALTNPPESDLSREPPWKDIRWSAAVRKASVYRQRAELNHDLEDWNAVLTETEPVLEAYFEVHAFTDTPFIIHALYYRGLAYEALDQPRSACEAYHQAIELAPGQPELDSLDAIRDRMAQLEDCP